MINDGYLKRLKWMASGDPLMHVGKVGQEAIRAALDELEESIEDLLTKENAEMAAQIQTLTWVNADLVDQIKKLGAKPESGIKKVNAAMRKMQSADSK